MAFPLAWSSGIVMFRLLVASTRFSDIVNILNDLKETQHGFP